MQPTLLVERFLGQVRPLVVPGEDGRPAQADLPPGGRAERVVVHVGDGLEAALLVGEHHAHRARLVAVGDRHEAAGARLGQAWRARRGVSGAELLQGSH